MMAKSFTKISDVSHYYGQMFRNEPRISIGNMENDNNQMSLLLSAGISQHMFDQDDGDEANHPATLSQQSSMYYHNEPQESSTVSSVGSPDFPSLPTDSTANNNPSFMQLQGSIDGDAFPTEDVGEDLAPIPAAHPGGPIKSIATSSLRDSGSLRVRPIAKFASEPDPESDRESQREIQLVQERIRSNSSGRLRSDSEVQKTSALLREQWMGRYHELIAYKRKHGHCNVPQREKQLGCWVSTQRTQYKLLLEGRPSQMNTERIDLLNELNFDWDPRGIWKRIRKESIAGEDTPEAPITPKGPDRNDRKWMQWYNELIRFKEKNGHCVVTRKLDNSLGIWVQKQRKLYRERQAGKASKILTSEKIDLLNDIGFIWEVPPGSRPSVSKRQKTEKESPKQSEWHQYFSELTVFKEQHGHCFVPDDIKDYSALAKWVSEQRQDRDNLSQDLKRKLDEIEFEWDSAACKKISDEEWNHKFFELSQFKVINGHTNVVAWPGDTQACSLAEWCSQQRYNYEHLWADRFSTLTEDRIKQLNQLGFEWRRDAKHEEDEIEWSAKLELLRQFRLVNGHCNVPRGHESLGLWVDAQRLAMKNLLEGAPSPVAMSWDRFSRLEAIGFEFSVRSSTPYAALSTQSQ